MVSHFSAIDSGFALSGFALSGFALSCILFVSRMWHGPTDQVGTVVCIHEDNTYYIYIIYILNLYVLLLITDYC